AEEERKQRSVFVTQARGQRVRVERQSGLVPVVSGRIRRRDPELERNDGEDRAEPEEERGPLGDRPHARILEAGTETEGPDTLPRCACGVSAVAGSPSLCGSAASRSPGCPAASWSPGREPPALSRFVSRVRLDGGARGGARTHVRVCLARAGGGLERLGTLRARPLA